LFPVHPYLLEMGPKCCRTSPDGAVALIGHNYDIGASPSSIFKGRHRTGFGLAFVRYLGCAAAAGLCAQCASLLPRGITDIDGERVPPTSRRMVLDAPVSSLFAPNPKRPHPRFAGALVESIGYQRAGWILRAVGMVGLAFTLFSRSHRPSLRSCS